MAFLVALDQGTTSSRTLVFDDEGGVVATAQEELPQHFPSPGLVEHDPGEIWATQERTIFSALEKARLGPRDIAGVGITNQRETTLLWERATSRPVCRAIVWQDRRTAPLCRALEKKGHGDLFRERTGLLLDPYFSGTKLAWMLEHVPGARERARKGELAFGTVDSWLVSKLTGGALHTTDVTNASRTLLFDIRKGTWDDELLAILDIPREIVPEVRSSCEIYGEVTNPAPLRGVPIAGIAGDQQAALMGQLCTSKGQAKCTYGTGCFLLLALGNESPAAPKGILTTIAWQRGTSPLQYALEGSVFMGGATIQWLRDGLGILEKASDVEPLARSVDSSAGVVLVPALTGLGAPYWDPNARGTLIGLTRGTTRAHIARAALEGIAHQVVDLAEAMEAGAPIPLAELRVDGGAARNDLLLQIQADLLGRPVVRPKNLETTALGAALLAGLATGVYGSIEDLRATTAIEKTFEPQASEGARGAARELWKRAVERSRDWTGEGA
jgi:glycerol kinase